MVGRPGVGLVPTPQGAGEPRTAKLPSHVPRGHRVGPGGAGTGWARWNVWIAGEVWPRRPALPGCMAVLAMFRRRPGLARHGDGIY